MATLLARILFYPTLAYTVAITRWTSRKWYNVVDDTVLIGALPFRKFAKELVKKENVKAIVSMNERYELRLTPTVEEWKSLGVDQLKLSTVDIVGTPSLLQLRQGVAFILSHREKGSVVYIHCKAGRSRSATLVLCYLIQVHRWEPAEALTFLKLCRPHVWLGTAQMNMVKRFHREVMAAPGRNLV